MAEKIKHYIITRFNLGVYRSKRSEESNQWVYDRLNLFENYCVPGVLNQTCKNFEWVIVVDSLTPSKTISRIKDVSNATILICEWPDIKFKEADCSSPWVNQFYDKVKNECEYAAQSRLDNDDVLSSKYVELIQSSPYYAPRESIIDFPHGIVVDTRGDKNNRYHLDHTTRGITPFCTLVEIVNKNMGTIYYTDHYQMKSNYKINIIQEIGWKMVIHGTNKTNDTFFDKYKGTQVIREIKTNQWSNLFHV